jgi:predicted nuclease of predicted toxin-antitoxin system
MRFLIDADLPRSVAILLRERGYAADDVRDVKLGNATDEAIAAYAKRYSYTLVSADRGFTNLLRFPLGAHEGIIVARFRPQTRARTKTSLLLRWISTLGEQDMRGSLLVVEPKGIRIRRPK